MPDKQGWHSGAPIDVDGTPYRWHYCPAADTDTLVQDTPTAHTSAPARARPVTHTPSGSVKRNERRPRV